MDKSVDSQEMKSDKEQSRAVSFTETLMAYGELTVGTENS